MSPGRHSLGARKRDPGSQIELDGDRLVSVVLDSEETDRARRRVMQKLERLRRGEHLR